jgi:very-short-patch-repair endonuclease
MQTEQKLYENLSPLYPNLKQQYKVDWCKNIKYLPFDFVLEEQTIIIELDGPQHFRKINDKWRTPEEEQTNDKYKIKCANDNGFSVIRVLQEDVFYDTYDWLNELDISVKKLIKEKCTQNIYLCKNNEYDCYI